MIELKNISKYYNTNGVVSLGLHNINLKLCKNEIIAITGESGSGKSTLLNVITKMDTFDEGEYYYKGNETSYFSVDDMDQFRKNKIGFIFQNYNIIDSYTVLENVMIPLLLKGYTRKDAKVKAKELINKVGLSHRETHRGTKLSGGEKQRCVIARALASDCDILACDEPTGNLDSKTGMEIINLIKEVAKDKLVLIVTHNYEQVESIATRKIKVFDGNIIEDQVFEKIEEDEKEELKLEYIPIKRKIDLGISTNNLKFTPRKTIFVSLVLLVIAIFSITLYQGCQESYSNYNYLNSLSYFGDNKIIAYNKLHEKLDMENFESVFDEYSVNQFYTESTQSFMISRPGINNSWYGLYVSYEPKVENYKMLVGEEPKDDTEVLLLQPYNDVDYAKTFYLGQFDLLDGSYDSYDKIIPEFKISGVAYSDKIESRTFTNNKIIENFFHNESFYFSNIRYEYSEYDEDTNSGSYTSGSLHKQYYSGNELKIVLPEDYQNNTFKLERNEVSNSTNIYKFAINPEIEYSDEVDSPKILIPYKTKVCTDTVYEISLYGNTDKIIDKLEDLGLNYIDVSKMTVSSKIDLFLANIQSYAMMLVCTIAIVILFFISYVVLAKIYSSKKNDYNILRTLGVTKKDMSRIVTYEVLIMTSIISIFTYLIIFILGKSITNNVFGIYKNIQLFTSILYFVVMMLFGYFIARRFNRKLFKFSVNKTFKSEVTKNA